MTKNEYIDLIDDKLDYLYQNMTYKDYLDFIKSNKPLKQYDYILGRISINYLPRISLILLTKNKLDKVVKIVSDKQEQLKRLKELKN